MTRFEILTRIPERIVLTLRVMRNQAPVWALSGKRLLDKRVILKHAPHIVIVNLPVAVTVNNVSYVEEEHSPHFLVSSMD